MEQSKRKEKITACVLVAFSIIYSLGCLNTRVGKIENPGAGLIPWLIAFLLILFTTINAVKAFKSNEKSNIIIKEEIRSYSYLAVIGIAGVILVYPFLLYTLKVILATFITVFAMLRFLRYKSAFSSFVISIIVSVTVFAFFAVLLGVTFPGGPVEQFLLRLR
jgi:putative tricarboxylic transport membrane protein